MSKSKDKIIEERKRKFIEMNIDMFGIPPDFTEKETELQSYNIYGVKISSKYKKRGESND